MNQVLLFRSLNTVSSLRKILCIWYGEHNTHVCVRDKIYPYAGHHEPLLSVVKRRQLVWFRYLAGHDKLTKVILQGTVEVGRRRGRQRKSWNDDIKKEWQVVAFPDWYVLLNTERWRAAIPDASIVTPQLLVIRLRDACFNSLAQDLRPSTNTETLFFPTLTSF